MKIDEKKIVDFSSPLGLIYLKVSPPWRVWGWADGVLAPMEAGMKSESTTLVVMQQDRRSGLIHHLSEIPVAVLTASSCAEAVELMRDSPAVRVVLTDLCLPDGSWFDVLNRVGDLKPDAQVVVCARLADERLWSQVLEAGGFDVLVEPYEAPEVRRILSAAVVGRSSRALAAAC